MSEKEKTSKIKDIKEIVLGAVEIMRQVRTPYVKESFDSIIDTVKVTKEIIESLKTPEMVKNIENFRLIAENVNQSTTKMQNTLKHLEETGAINDAKGLIKSAKNALDSFGGKSQGSINGQDLHEVSTTIKEMLKSIRSLVDELRITVAYSRSVTVHSIEETFKEV